MHFYLLLIMSLWKAPSTLLCPNNIRKVFRELHPYINEPSVEHCVPKSLYKQEQALARDMHNLISMPRSLNCHRSNFTLVNDMRGASHGWKEILEAKKNTKKKLFIPPEQYKGRYSRSIGYFYVIYPRYQDQIRTLVLDPELMLRWNSEYPPSSTEKAVHDKICQLQENENPLLVSSTRDDALHEIWSSLS
jgi:endonuclease I